MLLVIIIYLLCFFFVFFLNNMVCLLLELAYYILGALVSGFNLGGPVAGQSLLNHGRGMLSLAGTGSRAICTLI